MSNGNLQFSAVKKAILEFIKSNDYRPIKTRGLYKKARHIERNYAVFRNAVRDLAREGSIVKIKGGRLAVPSPETGLISGIFRRKLLGGGIVRSEDGKVIIIKRHRTKDALHGDTVIVKRYSRRGRNGIVFGEIVDVVDRAEKPVVGIFHKQSGMRFVSPTYGQPYEDIYMTGDDVPPDVNEGDHVVVEIVGDHGAWQASLRGRIIEVLGGPDTPGIDMIGLMRRYGLTQEFPEDVMNDVNSITDELDENELDRRLDLRDRFILTIDPVNAKDFDDALSVEYLPDGVIRLGVHIADVGHYVREDSTLDGEARARGTSVYLVDRSVPMLPEKLSGNLCSLRPGEDSLTKSVFMDVDSEGEVRDYRIFDSVIRSHKRLNYSQAQGILDDDRSADDELARTLNGLEEVTGRLAMKRKKRGALDFDLPEPEVILDENGRTLDIKKSKRLRSHQLIEDAMLLANTVVAGHLKKKKAPVIYRIHEEPDPKSMIMFSKIAQAFGFAFSHKKAHDKGYTQKFLEKIRGSKFESVLNMLFLRSLKKACYSGRNKGHYGLALDIYTHFTSPIRRYPDLYIHRLLGRYTQSLDHVKWEIKPEDVKALAESCSERERFAEEVERKSVKIKQVQFMAERLGEDFTGTITGMINHGFFVELDRFFIEGLVPVSSLEDDYYEFDESRMLFSGRSGRKTFRLGDRVEIRVAKVVEDDLLIDFELIRKIS